MLQKRSRLTKHDIEALKHARRIKSAHFLVLYGFSADSTAPKVSFSASKKVSKLAVVRNRLRRRGYSAIAPLLPQLAQKSLILIAYSSLWTESSIAEMTAELADALKKAGLYGV